MVGNSNGFYYGTGHTVSGSVVGNNYGFNFGTYKFTGSHLGNSYLFRSDVYLTCTVRNVANTYTFYDRNTNGYTMRVKAEHYGQTLNAHKIFEEFGDIIKTACGSGGNAPTIDPNGGTENVIEVSNIQSLCSTTNVLPVIDYDEYYVYAEAGNPKTFTFKINSTFALSAGEISLSASYLDGTTAGSRTITTNNTTAVSARSSAGDWSQSISVTLTPGIS